MKIYYLKESLYFICNIIMLYSYMNYHHYKYNYIHKSIFIYQKTKIISRDITTNIIVIGKKNSVESWITNGIIEYEKRLKPIMNLNTIFLKDNNNLIQTCKNIKGIILAMDENGKTFTSREFTNYFYKNIELGGATINFIIGGYDGLPQEILNKYPTISLSTMTWTHQMARLLLIEQIYRATEIHKNSGYHKD